MPALLWVTRSATPLTGLPRALTSALRSSVHVSVTVHPVVGRLEPVGPERDLHPTAVTRNDSTRPGSASTIVPTCARRLRALRLVPENVAPGTADVAPLRQTTPSFSGDHSFIRGRWATIAQTRSAGAWISVVTLSWSDMADTLPVTDRRDRG